MLDTSFQFVRDQQAFPKPHQSIKSQVAQDIIKRDIWWYGKKTESLPKHSHLPLQLQNISTETAIFISTRQKKSNMAVIQSFISSIISFTLNFFARNIKNQIETMIYFHRLSVYSSWVKTQKLNWNYLSICPDSWHNKKSLVQ